MIQVNRIYLIFNRLVTKKFLVDTSEKGYIIYDLDKGFIGWEEAGKEVEK